VSIDGRNKKCHISKGKGLSEMPVNAIKTSINLTTDVVPSNDGQTPPEMFAYVFSSNGRLLAQQPLEKGQGALDIGAKEGSRVSVFVGPEMTGEVTRAALHRRGAVVNDVIVSKGGLDLKVPVGVDIWPGWLPSLCTVQGTLLKHVQFGPIGFNQPVPNAVIEIYEVDSLPRIIWELPDDLLRRLREYVLRPIKFPFPPEPPEEIIGPLGPLNVAFPERMPLLSSVKEGGMAKASARHAMAYSETKANGNGNGASHVALSQPMMSHVSEAQAINANPSVLQYMAANASDLQFRQSLIDNATLVRPLLCLVLPNTITMNLITTTTTDDCGHFRTLIVKNYSNPDQPDLYFRARQHVLPFPFPMMTIYAPTPVSCYTHWNYQCGTEVTLITNNPFAIARPRCVDLSDGVIVQAIGNHSLKDIYGTSTALASGLAADLSKQGLTSDGRPWGGQLRLRLEFDPDLPTNDVKYYRVSYRRSGTMAIPTPMKDPITWSTLRFDPVIGPVTGSYVIGPKTANTTTNLYEIHSRGNDAPDGLGFWSGDVVVNYTNAIFNTTDPVSAAPAVPAAQPDRAGLFDIIIELFNANGDPVNLAAEDISFYVPESVVGDTQPDPASSLGLMQGNQFVFQLHIDNNPPVVEVKEPKIGSQGAGDCGALEYADLGEDVDVGYIAGQRNGFATYSFQIIKGHTDVRLNVGSTGAGSGSDTLVRSATASVDDLLNDYPPAVPMAHICRVGGLRASASVFPMATDGWSRVYQDISDTYSFALAPDEEEDA
jgi:hypothetical protein